MVAVVLSSANVVGYVKCSKQASKQLKDMATAAVTTGLTVSLLCCNSSGVASMAPVTPSTCTRCLRAMPPESEKSVVIIATATVGKLSNRQAHIPAHAALEQEPFVQCPCSMHR